jgi:putative transposase
LGRSACTAYPQGHQSDEQVKAFREHGKAETKRLSAARRRASRRARLELAPLSDGQTTEAESRLLPETAGADAARQRGDDALRRRSSTSLLGLVDPYALPPGQSYPTPTQDGS